MATKKTSHTFSSFNQAKFAATQEAWTGEAWEGKAFPTEIEQLMVWVGSHMETKPGDSTAYGVFATNSNVADAICEVAVTRKSVRAKWVKMLRVRLRPQIDDALNTTADVGAHGMREALDMFVLATLGLLKFSETEKANTVKIYGRTKQQSDFLRFLGIELERHTQNAMKAKMDGKFLVVESNK